MTRVGDNQEEAKEEDNPNCGTVTGVSLAW